MHVYGRIGPLYYSFYAPCAAVVESDVWVFYSGDYEIGAAWDVTPRSLVEVYGHFRSNFCLQLASTSEMSVHV